MSRIPWDGSSTTVRITGRWSREYMFGGTGFWDTFRALYQLFSNLVYPDVNQKMQEGLVNDYKEGGWLPEWSSPGYRSVMVGNNSASVVADALVEKGFVAMTHKHVWTRRC